MKSLLEQIEEVGNNIPSAHHNQESLGSFQRLMYGEVFNSVTNRPHNGWRIIGANKGLKTVWFEHDDGTKVFFHTPP